MTLHIEAMLHALGLVGLAELGDKSQLVVLTLAVRLGAWRVLLGASLAFIVLNLLAVTVGAALAAAIPAQIVSALAAVLFLGFGLTTLLRDEDEDEPDDVREGHPVLVTFSMIFVAELGDKTQLTVAGLAAAGDPFSTWLGATLALVGTSAMAALLGSSLLDRMPRRLLDLVAGGLFVVFGLWLGWGALSA